jgi:hypothetical protein
MIKKNILEIKNLVRNLHCMGTYGLVELELTEIEEKVEKLKNKKPNLTFEKFLEEKGYSWSDFDHTYEIKNLIEEYAKQ